MAYRIVGKIDLDTTWKYSKIKNVKEVDNSFNGINCQGF